MRNLRAGVKDKKMREKTKQNARAWVEQKGPNGPVIGLLGCKLVAFSANRPVQPLDHWFESWCTKEGAGYDTILTASVKSHGKFVYRVSSPALRPPSTSTSMSTNPTPTLSAHAARNPSKPIQQPRQRAHKSNAGSSTQAVNDAKLKHEEMLAEVDAFQELRHEKVKELAIKYEKDEAFFLKLLTNGAQYSGARNTTLWNAFKHDLAKQAKESEYIC